jgi:hypothetical protein
MLWKHLPHAAGEYHKRWELGGGFEASGFCQDTSEHSGWQYGRTGPVLVVLAAKEFVEAAELEAKVGLLSLLLGQQFVIRRYIPQRTLLSRSPEANDEAGTTLTFANANSAGPVLSSHLSYIVAKCISSGAECE